MASKVILTEAAGRNLSEGRQAGIISLDELKSFRTWRQQVEQFGIIFARAQDDWRDHALDGDRQWKGHRAISLSYSARVIYKESQIIIEGAEVIEIEIKVVKVTGSHSY